MTLGIFCVSRKSIVHVCDRTISTDMEVVCEKSNKNLILRTSDGVFTISYTGIAYLHPEGTDHWLAEAIIGQELDPEWTHVNISSIQKTSASTVWKVSERLKSVFRRNPQYFDKVIKVVIAGYTWPKNRRHVLMPMIYEIKKKKSNRVIIFGMSKEKSYSFFKNGFELYYCPDGYLSSSEKSVLKNQLGSSKSLNDVEINLQRVLVDKASLRKEIGSDIMTATVPIPFLSQSVGVKFKSLNKNSLSYTPWVIDYGKAHLPFQFQTQGGATISVGFVDFKSSNPWRNKELKVGNTTLKPLVITEPVNDKHRI